MRRITRRAARRRGSQAQPYSAPMRVAVISDVHGNVQALEAVLEAIDAAQVDEIWCLGDVVGYGADPVRCMEIVDERAAVCLAGNHDLVVAGRHRHRHVRPRRPRRRGVVAHRPRRGSDRGARHAHARRRARGRADVPRQRPRPGLGVRRRPAHGGPLPRAAAPAAVPGRPQPRAAPLGLRERRARRRHRGGGRHAGVRRGAVHREPRIGRPAARRRPPGGLRHPRHRPRARRRGFGPTTTSAPPRPRSAMRAFRCALPRGSRRGDDDRAQSSRRIRRAARRSWSRGWRGCGISRAIPPASPSSGSAERSRWHARPCRISTS